jgi:hypothetical protein
MEWQQTIAKKASHFPTCFIFGYSLRSLGPTWPIFLKGLDPHPEWWLLLCLHAIGLSLFSDGDMPVTGNIGGDIGDESQIPLLWSAAGFPSFTYLIIS